MEEATTPSVRPTILVVDDAPAVRAVVSDILVVHLGARVLVASNPDEALATLARETVDLVISDERMGPHRGTHFLARCAELAPDTPRILLTGYPDLDTAIEAVNAAKISKFLEKPVRAVALVRAVDDALAPRIRARNLEASLARARRSALDEKS